MERKKNRFSFFPHQPQPFLTLYIYLKDKHKTKKKHLKVKHEMKLPWSRCHDHTMQNTNKTKCAFADKTTTTKKKTTQR